jgi:hypothetical protein
MASTISISSERRRVAVVVEAKPDTVEAARARLDAIREEDELDVEDPGERAGFDMFSGGTYLPEVLAIWEACPSPSAGSSAATRTESWSSSRTCSSSPSPPGSPRWT